MKSFIVTGASASGKTTLINEAMKNGYVHLPTHTTRPRRIGEVFGIHNVYVSIDEFKSNLEKGMYFEPDLNYAEKNGVYYGTPRNWITCLERENYCATPITPRIAGMIRQYADVLWISLICDDSVRRRRLMNRGISEEEVEARLKTVNDHYDLPREALIFDTTVLAASDIFNRIKERD